MDSDGGVIHPVGDAQCLLSIASDNGHFWKTLWDHPRNAKLKQLRKSPTVLLAGDEVFIPDKVLGRENAATAARHTYKKLGTPAIVRFRMLNQGKPLEGLKYIAEVDGTAMQGKTDANGLIELKIPPTARGVFLRIWHGDLVEVHQLSLGGLDPITEESGVRQRLGNLGFDCGHDGSNFPQALRTFQLKNKLEPTGNVDDTTRDALLKAHGS